MSTNLQITNINTWGFDFSSPLTISGPCSAESEKQVVETAMALSKPGIDILRAGIWKPRTRPNAFEGVGSKGLKWLQTAKKLTGIPVAVEVANENHVKECLQNNIDFIWIGARTTVNPFAVQEIAEALRGTDIPVFVKNPINPDLELWIGALERLNQVGITKLVAIHRGFSTYEYSEFRNKPNWDIPLELKRTFPKLSIICDPSHICGNRKSIQSISQKAMDLAFDGLMIESHIDPTKALSDSQQQLTPSSLEKLLSNLIYRKTSTDNPELNSQLERLRKVIDSIDADILDNLSERMKIVNEIAHHKKLNNITILQQERWNQIINNALDIGSSKNLSDDSILGLFKIIHRESIRLQNEVMNSNEKELEELLSIKVK
ncbi:MAG: bifunctional 3-deoxy-7-phosphoheptulonate synthase/chorismate mutase type II [Bacteroidia bacterium]|nr:bifunctional 3-deoxy-7-phosphoheptulonate synthase/chorismate mutase type II [Bacteroidia bacterium]